VRRCKWTRTNEEVEDGEKDGKKKSRRGRGGGREEGRDTLTKWS